MSLPFYVSPEQLTKDRSDFARAGVAKGRALTVLQYAGGMVLATENPSRSLHKTAEIYDRIAFAAVGKYNEFEALRVAGVRYADLRGHAYDRVDVQARALAGAYAQTLGAVFTNEAKPLEVEIAVVEVGAGEEPDQIFRIGFDGSVSDHSKHLVIGGQADQLNADLAQRWRLGLDLAGALRLAAGVLAGPGAAPVGAAQLEVAILDRAAPRRSFRRLSAGQVAELLE